MPLPTNYSRPTLPYDPQQSLPNDQRFFILTTLQQPPTAEMFDAELNAIIDKINTLAEAINGVVVGAIPGSDNPLNANKFLVTDGAGNLSFILAGSDNIAAGAISTALLQNQAVTQGKIGNGAVGTNQLADNAVTTSKINNGAVTSQKLGDVTITASKIAPKAVTRDKINDGAVSTAQLNDTAVTTSKLNNGAVTAPKIGNKEVTLAKLAEEVAHALVPTGSLIPYAGPSITPYQGIPPGWIVCNGRSVLRSSYPALFALIGTTYGSLNAQEFNLPDLRGRAIFGYVAGSTGGRITIATANSVKMGGVGGEQQHQLTTAEMPEHKHKYTKTDRVYGSAGGGGHYHADAEHSEQTTSAGSGAAHNNMPPFILLNWLIKT